MPKLFEELEILCDADKRKSTNELPFVSAHMLHDLYLRWNIINKATFSVTELREFYNVLYGKPINFISRKE